MMEIVTRRDRREGFLADQMTMYSLNYIFQESFELSGTFVKMVLGDNRVDIDSLYDWCELNHVDLTNTLRKAAIKLYDKSSPYQKTIYFYKFIHDLGLELRDLISTVYNLLSDEIMHSGSELTYENIIWAYMDKLDEYTGLDTFTQSEHNLKIIDLFGMNTKDELKRLSGSVHDTFNNIIKNQYRVRLQEGMDALNSLRTGYIDTPAVWTGTTGTSSLINSTHTPSMITYNIHNSVDGTHALNTYTSSVFHNGISSVRYLVDGWEDLLHPNIGTQIRNTMLPNAKTLKKEKLSKNTPGVRRLNKSLKVFRKYVPSKLATDFLRCLEITIPGELYNWSLQLKTRKDLVTYSDYLNNYAISFNLYVMTKNNLKISRCCIVFNGCPILDEVLAIYMMIKTGREIDILNGSGFFDKDKTLFDMFVEPILQKKEIKTDAMVDLIGVYDTLDGSNPNRLQPEQIRHPAEIKSRIRSWLVSYLSRYIPDDIIEYTTNLDVSWDEAVDYEAFQLFNVNDFNHYVKPLTWSVSKPAELV